MEILSFVTETIIAVLGLIITIIEVSRNRLEKKELDDRKRIYQKLVNTVNSDCISGFREKYSRDIYNLQDVTRMNADYIGEGEQNQIFLKYYNDGKAFYENYIQYMKSINDIYVDMVKNEECFSLSYGFGRYIDAFRDFLQLREFVDDAIRDNEQGFRVIVSNFNDENKRVMTVFAQTMAQKMVYIYTNRVGDTHEHKMEVIRQYMEDEVIGGECIDRGERDKLAYSMFKWVMTNKKNVELLEERWSKLQPYIDEISIKYQK